MRCQKASPASPALKSRTSKHLKAGQMSIRQHRPRVQHQAAVATGSPLFTSYSITVNSPATRLPPPQRGSQMDPGLFIQLLLSCGPDERIQVQDQWELRPGGETLSSADQTLFKKKTQHPIRWQQQPKAPERKSKVGKKTSRCL